MNISKIKEKLTSPKVKEIFQRLKPQKSIWGFLSIVLLFIAPEIAAFIYGDDITKWCEAKLDLNPPYMESYLYENIIDLMGEGSWFNLAIGFAFLIWLFF